MGQLQTLLSMKLKSNCRPTLSQRREERNIIRDWYTVLTQATLITRVIAYSLFYFGIMRSTNIIPGAKFLNLRQNILHAYLGM